MSSGVRCGGWVYADVWWLWCKGMGREIRRRSLDHSCARRPLWVSQALGQSVIHSSTFAYSVVGASCITQALRHSCSLSLGPATRTPDRSSEAFVACTVKPGFGPATDRKGQPDILLAPRAAPASATLLAAPPLTPLTPQLLLTSSEDSPTEGHAWRRSCTKKLHGQDKDTERRSEDLRPKGILVS